MRTYVAAAAGLALAAAACGDNAIACGPGTIEMNGSCVPANCGGSGTMIGSNGACVPICTGGLVLDPTLGVCVIGPAACAAPNVIVNGVCENPDHALMVDVDEGVEPNGLGMFGEASTVPAGNVTLNPVGKHTVVHGHITPFEDSDGDGQLDPDVDSYLVAVGAPTLVSIQADGLGGLAAGFVAIAQVPAGDPLATWQRVGVGVATSSAQRQVYLPNAGTYLLAIADTRTIILGASATAGGPDAEYYVIIDQLDAPAPTPLTVTGGVATIGDTTSGDVKLYTVTGMGSGLDDVRVTTPLAGAQLVPAFDVYQNGAFRTQAAGITADAASGGYAPTDTATIVVDSIYDYAPMPAPFTLTVTMHDATALCAPDPTTCTNGTATRTAAADPSEYFFDAASADAVAGLAIAWNAPVQGNLVDQNGVRVATFTTIASGGATWQSYTGLVRVATAGRYYFVVADPTASAGTTALTATTTLAPIAATAVAAGTPATASTNAFGPIPFTYDAGTDPWQLFDATGTATGGEHVEWYAGGAAFGRLGALTTSAGTLAGEVAPLFAHDFTELGASSDAGCSSAGCGRVLLSDGTTTYFVTASPLAPIVLPMVTLTFGPRTIVDLGTIASGGNASSLAESALPGFYLLRTASGNNVTLTVSADTLQRVNADETALGAAGASVSFAQDATGWTAFVVTGATAPYDVTAAVQ